MLNFPRWKIVTILLACLWFTVMALPNFLSEKARSAIPAWLPSRTVSLGLDLQGGSHLLLKIDFDAYLKEHLENLLEQARLKFREHQVKYSGLRVQDGKLLVRLPDQPEVDLSVIIREVDPELSLLPTEGDDQAIGYSDMAMKRLKLQVLDKSMEIVERRVNETGTREPIIQRQGDERILLQVPGLEDPAQLKALLGKTAKMTFHLVDVDVSPDMVEHGQVSISDMIVPSMEKGIHGQSHKYAVKRRALLTGEQLVDASVSQDTMGRPAVSFRFNPLGAKKFGQITAENVGNPFAIILDNEVIAAPRINEPILGGSGIISGSFSPEEANQLAILLRSGSLPAPLVVMEERSVGPSLGADSVAAGKLAAAAGVGFVMLFMVLGYGLFGVFSNVALIVNMIMVLAFLSLFHATLTMPGIAGIVLTIGMAVDANVLIFERVREEQGRGKSPLAALDSGFKIAFGTIVDSNVTTLIAAVLLYYFGAGTIKGFAVTLSIGILASMFSAIVLTRLMVAVWAKRTKPKHLPI